MAAAQMCIRDRDVTVRGAVSIGRRLMDPLAELVKIDPKSIGVGQYQHCLLYTSNIFHLNGINWLKQNVTPTYTSYVRYKQHSGNVMLSLTYQL